jgi:polar amino acid transport system substrate-binding protein
VVTEESSYTYVSNGQVAGPATEVVKATLEKARVADYQIAVYPWARAYGIAAQKPNVLIYPIVRTAAREKLFNWVGELARVPIYLYRLRSADNPPITSLADAKSYSIGVVRADSREYYLRSQGFEKLVVAADNDENFRLFSRHLVQLIPLPEKGAFCQAQNLPFTDLEVAYSMSGMDTPIYMAYSLGTSEDLIERTSRAFAALVGNGTVGIKMR